MDILSEDFCAWLGDARRDLERDLERRQEALENQQRMVMALQKVEEIASENQSLQQQLAEEKQQRAELEMKMADGTERFLVMISIGNWIMKNRWKYSIRLRCTISIMLLLCHHLQFLKGSKVMLTI